MDAVLSGPHGDLVEPVRPDANPLFVVKGRHSIFYQTPLKYLLRQHGILGPHFPRSPASTLREQAAWGAVKSVSTSDGVAPVGRGRAAGKTCRYCGMPYRFGALFGFSPRLDG